MYMSLMPYMQSTITCSAVYLSRYILKLGPHPVRLSLCLSRLPIHSPLSPAHLARPARSARRSAVYRLHYPLTVELRGGIGRSAGVHEVPAGGSRRRRH